MAEARAMPRWELDLLRGARPAPCATEAARVVADVKDVDWALRLVPSTISA